MTFWAELAKDTLHGITALALSASTSFAEPKSVCEEVMGRKGPFTFEQAANHQAEHDGDLGWVNYQLDGFQRVGNWDTYVYVPKSIDGFYSNDDPIKPAESDFWCRGTSK